MTTTVYDSKKLMAVPVPGIANLMYGFYTNLRSATSTELGHVPGTGTGDNNGYIANIIIGANYPKPQRASKRGVAASYCAPDKVATLRTSKWSISPARYKSGGKKFKSRVVYVEVGFIKYAWTIPDFLYNQAAFQSAISGLGITVATANDRDLVFGSIYPKPPKASFFSVVGDETNSFSTYIAPLKIDSLPDGWSLSDPGNYPITSALP